MTPATLYVGTCSIFQSTGGLFKSTNGGGNWSASNTGLTGALYSALAIDPVTPTTLYAAVDYSGVFKSTDGGKNWLPDHLDGFFINTLEIDPTSPNILYAGPDSNAGVYAIHH